MSDKNNYINEIRAKIEFATQKFKRAKKESNKQKYAQILREAKSQIEAIQNRYPTPIPIRISQE